MMDESYNAKSGKFAHAGAGAAREAVLCAAYRDEADLYRQALELCEHHAATPALSASDWLPGLGTTFEAIAAIECRIALHKKAWQAEARPAGPELAQALAEVAQLLQKLNGVVTGIMAELEQVRLQLPVELEKLTRTQRMQRAYHRTAWISPASTVDGQHMTKVEGGGG